MSNSPISPENFQVIADFGKTDAFRELFDALELGCINAWKASRAPELRELAWHEYHAAQLLRDRIAKITKKMSE